MKGLVCALILAVGLLIELSGYIILTITAGLWWLPKMIEDTGLESSFLRASIFLLANFVLFYKNIFQIKNRRSGFSFYLACTTVGLGIVGYFYGIFRVFL